MCDETKIDWSPPMPDDQMAAAYQSVQAKLTRTAGGEVRNTLQNFVTALTYDPIFAGNIRRKSLSRLRKDLISSMLLAFAVATISESSQIHCPLSRW